MTTLAQRLAKLSAAEDFLEFFGIPYDMSILNVSRLHILQRFHQYMRQEPALEGGDELETFKRLRGLLARAYGDFVRSTPAREKVFKVFRNHGLKTVSLERLHGLRKG